jgi:Outer membrane lipoprotein-sorting protein
MMLRSSLALLCLTVAAAAFAATPKPPAEMSAEEIQSCVQRNFPSDSMVQTVRMVSLDRLGVERVLEAEMFWQRDPKTELSNVLLIFDNPPELRGASVLVLEKKPQNDMFMFLPELGKTRRITTQMVQGNMMGTDFSYEDFQRLQGMLTSLQTKRLDDETMSERKAFVTESMPTSDVSSEYARIRSWIDQETCVPLQVEFFTKDDATPVKRMTTNPKSYSQEKTGFIPREIAMKDLRTETATTIVIEKLKVSVPIERKRFSAGELERQGRFQSAPTH